GWLGGNSWLTTPTGGSGSERAGRGGLERCAPGGELAQHLVPGAAWAVDQPGAEAVLPTYFVPRQEVLKVPGRVGGLGRGVAAAAAGRVRQADALGAVEPHH